MAKYLFLLGFFLFSTGFLSTPVVTAVTGASIYTGIVYKNYDADSDILQLA